MNLNSNRNLISHFGLSLRRLNSNLVVLCAMFMLTGLTTSQAQNSPYRVNETILRNTIYFSDWYPGEFFTYIRNPQHGTFGAAEFDDVNNLIKPNYKPDSNFVGIDRFTVEYKTGINPALSEIYYVDYVIEVRPSLIFANEDFYYIEKNSTNNHLDIIANDYSTCGYEALNHISVSENGQYTIQNDSVFYTPKPDYMGVSYLHYTVCDSLGACGRTTVNIVVFDSMEVDHQEELFVSNYGELQELLAHDGWSVDNQPALGEVTFNTDGNQFMYDPMVDEGLDTFSITNGTETIEYLVHVIPVTYNSSLEDDKVYLRPGEAILFDVQDNDLNGNFYLDGNTEPNIGELINYWDGRFVYTADSSFRGTQTFEYEVCTWNHCETATVELIIGEFLPDNSERYTLNTLKNQDLAISYDIPLDDNSITISQAPFFGTIYILSEGDTLAADCGTIRNFEGIIYRPLPNLGGVDRFTLEFCSAGICKNVDFNVNIEHHSYTSCLCAGSDCIWPGDINADGDVNLNDMLSLGYCMGENGAERLDAEPMHWFAQNPVDWNGRIQHADVDGDGRVTEFDLEAIDNFMGNSHGIDIVKPALLKPYDVSIVLGVDTVPHIGDTIAVYVQLGSETNPAVDVHGFSTTLSFNPDVVDSAYMPVSIVNNSYLTREGATLFRGSGGNGRADIGISRVDREARTGFDLVTFVEIVIEDDLDGLRTINDQIQIPVHLENMSIQHQDGQIYTLPTKTEYITVRIPNVANAPKESDELLNIKPTITTDFVTVSNDQHISEIGRVEVYNIQGQLIHSSEVKLNQDYQIDASKFGVGLYLVKQTSSERILTGKFEKL